MTECLPNPQTSAALAQRLPATRVYAPDRDFQLAALRVVLGLPRRLGRSGGAQ